jgi:hypothetical protein
LAVAAGPAPVNQGWEPGAAQLGAAKAVTGALALVATLTLRVFSKCECWGICNSGRCMNSL